MEKKKSIYLPSKLTGRLAERLGSGLQNLLQRFKSATVLNYFTNLIRLASEVLFFRVLAEDNYFHIIKLITGFTFIQDIHFRPQRGRTQSYVITNNIPQIFNSKCFILVGA